ncbi:MAG: transcriptional regulator [Deltaproteobacteria bacterium]|nr:transcriptional regulator [Deltaproteobacteria bacterium]
MSLSTQAALLVRPIRNDRDHAATLKEIARLWDDPSPAAAATVEVLSVVIDAYEREHHAIEPPDPIAAIEFRMDQLGMSRSALGAVLGSRSRATEVLSRTRPLTLQMIRKLNASLGIPAEVLIREPKARAGRTRPTMHVRKARRATASR